MNRLTKKLGNGKSDEVQYLALAEYRQPLDLIKDTESEHLYLTVVPRGTVTIMPLLQNWHIDMITVSPYHGAFDWVSTSGIKQLIPSYTE